MHQIHSCKAQWTHQGCRGAMPRNSIPILSILRAVFLTALAAQFAPFPAAVAAAATTATTPPDGKAIFAKHCAVCHGEMGQGRSAVTSIAGPNLQAEHNEGHILSAVEVGPSHMPSFAYVLSIPEMQAVATYVSQQIAIIPLAGGNLSDGGKLFRAYCAACHRTSVRGGALAFTDINAPALTDKSSALIAGAIRWGPGPMPSFPQQVLTDKQLASIVDYVKFAQHPPSPGGATMNFYGPSAEGFVGFLGLFLLIGLSMWIEKGGKG